MKIAFALLINLPRFIFEALVIFTPPLLIFKQITLSAMVFLTGEGLLAAWYYRRLKIKEEMKKEDAGEWIDQIFQVVLLGLWAIHTQSLWWALVLWIPISAFTPFRWILMIYNHPHILITLLPQWFPCKQSVLRFMIKTKRIEFPEAFAFLIKWSKSPQARMERARGALKKLREGECDQSGVNYWLESIVKALETGISYKRIGTTKEEIIAFWSGKKSQKIYAKKKIRALREGKDRSAKLLTELLEREGIAPEEIGTSLDELRSFRRLQEKKLYLYYLDNLRTLASGELPKYDDRWENVSIEHYVSSLLEAPDKGDPFMFTFEELGTSEEEVRELGRSAHLHAGKAMLASVRESPSSSGIEEIQEHLRLANVSSEAIGLTKVEISAFLCRVQASEKGDSR